MSRSSRLEPGLNLNSPGVVGVMFGLNEWRVTITTLGFDPFDISVGFDTCNPSLDVDFLSQWLDERQ